MRVALLTQVLPYPPDSGPEVKTWNLLKYLAQHHEITLISFVRGDQSADIAELQPYCRAVHVVPIRRGILRDGLALVESLLTWQPWTMMRDKRVAMRHLVDRLATGGSFDVVHADQLNMAQYAERVGEAIKVLDAHNALWLLYKRLAATMRRGLKRWLLEREWRLLKRYEGNAIRNFDSVLSVSQEDKDALLDAAALLEAAAIDRKIVVIPIAVDVDEVRPVARRANANRILHVGTMYWPPNIDGVVWFIREVFPLVRKRRPDVVFDVIGARPPATLRRLGSSASGVNVAGYVADLAPYLEHAGVFVVPLRAGGGMRVKILNALAQGFPVVSTTLGVEGIAALPGRHLLVADTAEGFAEAVIQVLNDSTLATRLGHAGRCLVEQLYDYRTACRPLDRVYRR